MKKIAERIKKHRIKAGMTQQDMSEFLNISQSAYAKIESDQTRLDIERLFRICEIFSIQPTQLVDLTIIEHEQGETAFEIPDEKSSKELLERMINQFSFLKKLLAEMS